MVSYFGWLNGIIAIGIFAFSIIIGILFIYKSRKTEVILLSYSGFMIIFAGLMFLGPIVDFFSILFTGVNLDNSFGLYGILSYIWTAPLVITAIYIGVELIMPEYHKLLLVIFLVLSFIFELFIIFDPLTQFEFTEPSGDIIIDSNFKFGSITFIIIFSFLISILIINGIGILLKGLKSKSLIRKKFIILSISFDSYITYAVFDTVFPHGPIVFIARILMISSPWLLYIGLKEPNKEKKKKIRKPPSEKEMKLRSFILGKPKPVEKVEEFVPFVNSREGEILVFVSHATKDTSIFNISEISNLLSKYPEIKKAIYWEEDMKDNIIKFMNDNLGKCHVVLLFCSENALYSNPVEKEWTAADALGKPIIPIFFDTAHIPPILQSRLGVEFDFYDIEKNVKNLYNLILRKCELKK
ncbi:MAG: toll/interleukin-1 receptor domain-containing protein [Promethearchaeota archaeon]